MTGDDRPVPVLLMDYAILWLVACPSLLYDACGLSRGVSGVLGVRLRSNAKRKKKQAIGVLVCGGTGARPDYEDMTRLIYFGWESACGDGLKVGARVDGIVSAHWASYSCMNAPGEPILVVHTSVDSRRGCLCFRSGRL